MSRIIKFRAWDGKRMQKVCRLGLRGFSTDLWSASPISCDIRDTKSLNIMQFTGLLDCNFQEVYESDIVNIRNWGRTDEVLAVAEIVWNEAGWDFEPFFDVDSYDKFRRIEVIGNKWENPGLLE